MVIGFLASLKFLSKKHVAELHLYDTYANLYLVVLMLNVISYILHSDSG